jgi:hypothetical protein
MWIAVQPETSGRLSFLPRQELQSRKGLRTASGRKADRAPPTPPKISNVGFTTAGILKEYLTDRGFRRA